MRQRRPRFFPFSQRPNLKNSPRKRLKQATMTSVTALSLSIALMSQSNDAIVVKPAEQAPQSLTIEVRDESGVRCQTMHYLLFTPREYSADGQRWPMLLFLHGLGECGNNELQRVKIHGPPKLVESRPNFPFVVVSPQCPPQAGGMADVPTAWKPDQLIQLVDHVLENLRIDPQRVYVTGLSMGGYGTWRLVARYPQRFAAALPICGGGQPHTMAAALRRVPIWTFHGARDAVVPLSESQAMVDAVCRAGGCVRFTVYDDVEHDSWTRTYEHDEVYDWLLSHRGPLE
jgi:predicted peptidase